MTALIKTAVKDINKELLEEELVAAGAAENSQTAEISSQGQRYHYRHRRSAGSGRYGTHKIRN